MTSPFKFLDAFTAEDKDAFFGREQEVAQLHFMVQKTPLLLLYGLSGTGKTSLVQCGLANKFDGPDWLPVWVRRQGNLNEALLRALDQLLPEEERSGTISDRVRALYNRYLRPVYLIFDQFEELVILGKDQEREREIFARDLKQLVQSGMPCTSILIIREEYIGSLFWLEREIPILFEYRLRIEPMSRRRVEGVLQQSFKQFNISVEPPESDRYGEMIQNVSKGRSGIELPYLQVYLDALYRNDYERTEKEGALKQAAQGYPALVFTKDEIQQFGDIEEVLDRFVLEQQQQIQQNLTKAFPLAPADTVKKILNAFVTEEGTKQPTNYQRQAGNILPANAYLDALALPSLPPETLTFCIEAMQKARLLRVDENSIELAHDSLAALIYQRRSAEERKRDEAKRSIQQFYREWTAKRGSYLTRKQLRDFEPYIPQLNLSEVVLGYVQKSRQYQRLLRGIQIGIALILALLCVALVYIRAEKQRKEALTYAIAQARVQALTDPTRALQMLEQTRTVQENDPNWLTAYAEIYNHNEFYEDTLAHTTAVKGVIFAPDSSGILYSWTAQSLYKWTANHQLADSTSVQDLTGATLSPDGKILAAGTYDGRLLLFQTNKFQLLQAVATVDSNAINALVFSADGRQLFGAGSCLFELTRKDTFSVTNRKTWADAETAMTLSYLPVQKALLLGFKSGQIARAVKNNIQFLPKIQGHKDQVLAIAEAPDHSGWVSAGRDALIKFWDEKNTPQLTIKGHDRRINRLAWSPDGSRLFSAGNDFQVKSWSPEGDLIAAYKGHRNFVNDIAVSPDGSYIASAGDDRVVRLWRVESKVKQHYGPHPDGAGAVAISRDGRLVLSGGDVGRSAYGDTGNDPNADFEDYIRRFFGLTPRSAYLWDAATGALLRELKGHQGGINAVAIGASGKLLLTASDDQTIIAWNERGDSLRTLKGVHRDKVLAVALSPDGQTIASGGYDSLLVLWDASGKMLQTIHHPALVASVAFSPKGDFILTGCYDGVARLYDRAGKLSATFAVKDSTRINAVAFSADGQYAMTGDWNNTLQIVHLQSTKILSYTLDAKNKTGGESINAIAVAPDGEHIAVAAEGGIAQCFYFKDNILMPVQSLQHYPWRSIRAIAYTPDGKGVLTGSGDGWVRWWK